MVHLFNRNKEEERREKREERKQKTERKKCIYIYKTNRQKTERKKKEERRREKKRREKKRKKKRGTKSDYEKGTQCQISLLYRLRKKGRERT